MAERKHDRYYRAAQREGLRSRAAFKLLQLQERFHLLAPGDRVLDLGASPGGWSLAALEIVGHRGEVVSVDLRSFEPVEGIRFIRGRVGDPKLLPRLGGRVYDAVVSDMAPSLSGNYATDHARSVELVRLAFGVVEEVLKPGGTFVAKVFQGDLLPELTQELSGEFERFQATKPHASRGQSSEMYLLGRMYRGPVRGTAPLGG
jgi:23S rRNA (uridine2552-2'-O)-methyltransferase